MWLEELNDTPDECVNDFIFESLKDKEFLHIFGRYFFPHIIKGTNPVPDCHLDLLAEINSPKDRVIIFPRGFAKTTWEKIDTIHDIVYKLEPVILYISNTIGDAQFHFESIKAELENNLLLIDVYGFLVPDEKLLGRKWTNKHFETLNGVNVIARGAGKGRGVNIKNQRPTKIIGDDLEDDEMVRSAEQREKLMAWIKQVVFPSKDPKRGKFKMIGTVLHQQAVVLQMYKAYGGIFRRAIENGESIWPDYFSIDDLNRIKDGYIDEDGNQIEGIGSRAFNQEYMNEPLSDDMAHMQPKYIDDNLFTVLPEAPLKKMVMYMDPQAGETGAADEYCITILQWHGRDRHRYVVEQVAGRATQLEQAKIFIKTWIKYRDNIKVAAIEKVLNQTAVFQNVLSWKTGALKFDDIPGINRNIPVKGVSPAQTKSKYGKDKLGRLQMHEPSFERGEIHLRPEMTKLRNQILFLGSNLLEHDDRVDSLVGALELSFNLIDTKRDNVYNKDKNSQTIAGNLNTAKF